MSDTNSKYKLNPSPNDAHSSSPTPFGSAKSKIVKRFGGRHLIFRTRVGGWPILPKPYVLISAFSGPVWIFYGVGQIWLTHKKTEKLAGWYVRAPRVGAESLMKIVESIHSQLEEFVKFCNDHGFQGTLVIEKYVLEFHWTFGTETGRENQKGDNSSNLEKKFQELIDSFQAASAALFPARQHV